MQKLKKKIWHVINIIIVGGLEIFVKLYIILCIYFFLVNQNYFNISECLDILEMFTYQASFQLKQSPSSLVAAIA